MFVASILVGTVFQASNIFEIPVCLIDVIVLLNKGILFFLPHFTVLGMFLQVLLKETRSIFFPVLGYTF